MSGVITVENLEKQKKDLKWLKEAVLELKNNGNPEKNQTEAEREIGRLQELTWNNCVDRIYELINQLDESEASRQIDKLASFIMDEVEGEPSQSQSAVDTAIRIIKSYQNQATLSQEWIDEHSNGPSRSQYVWVDGLQNLLVSKKEEVDRAYKDGYEKGKEHATEKQSEVTETVAGVLVDYLIASAKLKLALNMEVEEVEE